MADSTTEKAQAREGAGERLIRTMPEALANKIAAGEVVQRPASVAKELIENALDAGAEEVRLVLKKSGRELVQVIDDGCGMSRADAEACFGRHATSKIQSIADLERLATLGFRGEALASIAAVAQVELKTKRAEDAAGTRLRIEGGETVEVAPCAAPGGTSMAVRNLFYNVPVRRNFLKTPATEFKHLAETFQFLALSNPEVAFGMEHNGSEVYRLPRAKPARRGAGFFEALSRRVAGLFGEDRAQHLLRVEEASSYLSIEGVVGAAEAHRRTRGEQFLFVNGRYVENRYLAHAVKTAYGNLLPDGAFPFFALFLHLDPRRVDVNVHPTKAEVKFDDQSGVYAFVQRAVRHALGTRDLAPRFVLEDEDDGASGDDERPMPVAFQAAPSSLPASPGEAPSRQAFGSGAEGRAASRRSSADRHASSARRSVSGNWAEDLYAPFAPDAEATEDDASGDGAEGEREAAADAGAALPEGADVWQLAGRYLVTTTEAGLLVIDQHAAHKRVLYERALSRLEAGEGATQQLLFPHTFDVPAAEADLFEELLPDLCTLGFDLEAFSGRTVAVRGVPTGVREGEVRALLEGLLEQYRESARTLRLGRAESLARALAGRGAIPAGQRLSPAERQALARDLFRCEMPYADPQGRPTTATLTPEELAERFEA